MNISYFLSFRIIFSSIRPIKQLLINKKARVKHGLLFTDKSLNKLSVILLKG